ncbi:MULTISPECIES: hypothetical protein [Tenacibaculum]|uniref:Uncharacterized protein n=1 Tax=Tenacibaculum caenipelagi TaxID=1325435 RepID=A0A4V3D331_9FLAO|nr:hypothetical protein [Tenacibaculum caenipelagi]TDQ27724.1 hypothetical protein DFQ07_1575 [Tenacibaculum caenipelagi]
MKSLNTTQNIKNQFIVSKKQVSKNKVLKTSILYDKIESSVQSSLNLYKNSSDLSFKSIEFDLLENAYLNDKLIIKNNIKKLSTTEVVLNITVSKKEEKKQDIICTAVFGYSLEKAS